MAKRMTVKEDGVGGNIVDLEDTSALARTRYGFAEQALDPIARLHMLRLARTEHVGPISFFHLMQRFKNAKDALAKLPHIMSRRAVELPSIESVQKEMDEHARRGYHLLSYYDSAYPSSLRAFRDAPPFISACGRLDLLNKVVFAMVGSRHASAVVERFTLEMGTQLAAHKWVLVSGLARGVDACVHRAGLDGCGTIAVIAGGLGHIYPPEHKELYAEIAHSGLILTEDPLHRAPSAGLFAKRNRLISGLAWGVLVVEASAKSGALLTAKYALDQGKSVLAVPGHPLDFRSKGTNKLIKQGAVLVDGVDDVLFEYTQAQRYIAHEPEEEFNMSQDIPSYAAPYGASLSYVPDHAYGDEASGGFASALQPSLLGKWACHQKDVKGKDTDARIDLGSKDHAGSELGDFEGSHRAVQDNGHGDLEGPACEGHPMTLAGAMACDAVVQDGKPHDAAPYGFPLRGAELSHGEHHSMTLPDPSVSKVKDEDLTPLASTSLDHEEQDLYQKIMILLHYVPVSVSELAARCHQPIARIRSALIEMELNGDVQWAWGDHVQKSGTACTALPEDEWM
jgi:DNA processing protein